MKQAMSTAVSSLGNHMPFNARRDLLSIYNLSPYGTMAVWYHILSSSELEFNDR